jgi:hypothetical protein
MADAAGLRKGEEFRRGISAIALSVGYESESAFGKAFKRVMGCSLKQYSQRSSSTPRSLERDRSGCVDEQVVMKFSGGPCVKWADALVLYKRRRAIQQSTSYLWGERHTGFASGVSLHSHALY